MTTNLNDVATSLTREISYNFNTQIQAMRWLKDIMTRECDRLEALYQPKPDGSQGAWPKEDVPTGDIARAMAMVASEIQNSLVADVVRTGSRASAVSEVIEMLK
jgi:hypothetical protein